MVLNFGGISLVIMINSPGTKHKNRGRRGRDRMVIVLTTIYAISDYHH
jgi:hypothetical protein